MCGSSTVWAILCSEGSVDLILLLQLKSWQKCRDNRITAFYASIVRPVDGRIGCCRLPYHGVRPVDGSIGCCCLPYHAVRPAVWCWRECCPPCSLCTYTCHDFVLRCPQNHNTFCTCGQWMTRVLNCPTPLTTPPPTLPSCTGTPLKEGRRSTCMSCLRAWKSRRASRIKRTSSTTSTHICQWLFIHTSVHICQWLSVLRYLYTHLSVAIYS